MVAADRYRVERRLGEGGMGAVFDATDLGSAPGSRSRWRRPIPEYVPWVLRAARAVDDVCHALGLPHALDLLLVGLPSALLALLIAHCVRSR